MPFRAVALSEFGPKLSSTGHIVWPILAAGIVGAISKILEFENN